jgi:O-antigen ligase
LRRFGSIAVAVAVGVAAVAVIAASAYFLSDVWTTGTFVAFVGGAAAVAASAVAVFLVEPALILSVGMALSLFSGKWNLLGAPSGLDHLVLMTGVFAVLLRAARRPGEWGIELRPVHSVLAVLGLYAIGSALWSNTLTDNHGLFGLLDKLGLVPFMLFFVAPTAFRTARQRSYLMVTLVLVGAYLGLTAVLESVGPKSLVVPSYINDPSVGIHADRARGPFVEAGANGLALFICGVAASLAFAAWRERPRARAAALAVVGLCAVGIVLTVTRQSWLAVVATFVVLLSTPRLRRYTPFAAAALAAVAVGTLVFVPNFQKKADERAGDKSPVWDRLNSDRAALRMVQERPLLGFGWGRFGAESNKYYSLARTYPLTNVSDVHNVFLSNAVELGAVGVLLWIAGLLGALVRPLLTRGPPELEPWRVGLLAVLVAWFVQANFTPLSYVFPNSMLWLWAGVASVGLGRSPARSHARRSWRSYIGRASVAPVTARPS